MTNKMKSVGEALQGFLETAVPSPLSAEERERLRLYNPTLAAQIDALDWKDVPSFIVAIIEEWRRSGSPSSKACHPLAAPEERKRPSPVSLEELAREQAREVACEVVRTASPKPIPAPSPVDSAPVATPLPAPKEEERPSLWCGYPTSIARVSPFFPMNNLEKGRRDALMRDPDITSREKGSIAASGAFFFKERISSGPWGDILYTGPKLSVEEEDVLMALLAIIESGAEGAEARHARSAGALPVKDTEEGFVPVAPNLPEAPYVSGGVEAFPEPVRSAFPESGTGKFTYRGPLLPILRLMGHKRPGKNHYTRLVTGLTCLAHGTIELVVRERGQETFYDLTHIISNLRLRGKNDAERDISVTISPFFREMYLANRLTWIDVAKRFQIRGSIAKAMYRFCQSHRENPVFRGDIRTLALALNMDLRSPLKETRRQIRDAIAELAEKKVLEKTSILTKGNIVILNRTAEALPSRRRGRRKED